MSQHLPLAHLTSFAARLHMARHVGSLEPPRLQPSDVKVIEAIAREADTLATLQSKNPGHYTLTRRFEVLRSYIEQKRLTHEISEQLAGCLQKLCKDLEDSTCNDCLPEHRQCRPGSTNTFEQVDEKGLCIEPVKQICDKIHKWISKLWEDLSDSAASPEIVFSTSHVPEFGSLSGFIQTFSISGSAMPVNPRVAPIGQPQAKTRITIEVLEARFGWMQYCVLPYLFLHEILCHAFQGIEQRPVRERSEDDCPWSEGWMDRLAYLLAREWLEGETPAQFHIATRTQLDHAVKHTIDLHEARYSVGRPGAVTGSDPSHGRDVFDKVLQTYDAVGLRLPVSQQTITKVSLRLNAEALRVAERRSMVLAIEKLTANQSDALHHAFGRYAAHGRIDALRECLGS